MTIALFISTINFSRTHRMIKQAGRFTFYIIIFLNGIIIGGIYTPEVVTFFKQYQQQGTAEEQPIQPKKHKLKIRKQRLVQLVDFSEVSVNLKQNVKNILL